jgi:hypothetical protein
VRDLSKLEERILQSEVRDLSKFQEHPPKPKNPSSSKKCKNNSEGVFGRDEQHMPPGIKGASSHTSANERRKNVTFVISSTEERKQSEKHASTTRQVAAAQKAHTPTH